MGGRERCLDEEEKWTSITRRYVPAPPDPDEKACDCALEHWQKARAFEKEATALLCEHGLTFTEWRILHAAAKAIRLTGDAVSQLAIAGPAQLNKGTMSKHAWRMQGRGWLDSAPAFVGSAYRIIVTGKAMTRLAATRMAVARLALRIWGIAAAESAAGDAGTAEMARAKGAASGGLRKSG